MTGVPCNVSTGPVRGASILCILALLATCGCRPGFYRHQADLEVSHLVSGSSQPTRDPLTSFGIDVDPRSRMYDPSPPDQEPMPPDDPASHDLMHCVDCKRGYPCWHKNGDTPFTENPEWTTYIPVDSEGEIRLDIPSAVRMALLQSSEFQGELETLYLSALDVSFERFRFDVQFFGGYEGFFTSDGPDRVGGPSSRLELSTRDIQMRKMFATGGELVVGLANSLIWEFSGADRHTAFTLLDFSLVQPLLRMGNRAQVLERLTLAERGLLANVRQMERFRRGFYAEIATGLPSGSGPSRRGGLAGSAGLEGFTGVGAGGFGRLGNVTGGGRTGTGAAGAGGFLGLLQQVQQLRNEEANIESLRNSLTVLEAKFEAGGRIDFFQVELARQALYNAKSRYLTGRSAYEGTLDNFKIEMGLPPDAPVVLDDPLLDRFRLLDPTMTTAERQWTDLLNRVRAPNPRQADAPWDDLLADVHDQIAHLQEQFGRVQDDLDHLHRNLPARRANLRELARRTTFELGDIRSEAYDLERFNENVAKIDDAYEMITASWKRHITQFDMIEQPTDRNRLITQMVDLSQDLQDLALVQARARLASIVLKPVDVAPEMALKVASEHRRDWMNARAALVDSWTLIEFNALNLQSDLNVVFSGDISNTGDNPLRLQGSTGRLRVGLEWDAPLTRLVERNNYRQALIEYQQARRGYYTFVDRVHQGLRSTLRTIAVDQLNFEMRRAAVELAISQVELARLELDRPPEPGVTISGTDNRVNNLVNALNQLLTTQNDILSIWTNFYVQRLSLQFQMGTMQLDSDGLWIDPGPIVLESVTSDR